MSATAPTRAVFVGFMGAGKTTVAREVARLVGGDSFLDLDDLITAREGRTPQRLIDEAGEAAFRAAETRALRDALQHHGTARVIALGGGAWTRAENRDLIRAHKCFTVWLDASFALCWRRITDAGNTRPLARDEAQARALYDERRARYELADLRVSVRAADSAEEIAARIIAAWRQYEATWGKFTGG